MNVKNKNIFLFVVKIKIDDVINLIYIFLNFLVNLELKLRWKYELFFYDELLIVKIYYFLVWVIVVLIFDVDIDC